MSIRFDSPVQRMSQASAVDNRSEITFPQIANKAGLSDIRSSVSTNDHTEEMGFCRWLGKKIDEIFQALFSCIFSRSRPEPVQTAEMRLNNRIEMGNEIIERHFSIEALDRCVPNRTAVVVVIKYNGQVLAPFSRLTEGKEAIKAGVLGHLHQLLSNDSNRSCEDGYLEVDTFLFEKHQVSGLDFNTKRTIIQFPNVSNSSNGSGSGPRADRLTVYSLLNNAIPNNQTLAIDVADFVLNRL